MSLSSFNSIQFKDDDFPLLSQTKFNQQFIEKDGNQISMSNLVLLPQVLSSLDLPPDAVTLLIDHRILLKDFTNTQTQCDVRNDYFIIDDTVNSNYYSFNSDTLQVDNSTNPSYIRMNPYDGLMIQNDTKSGAPTSKNTFSNTQITIDNTLGGGPLNTLTAGDMTIQDNTATMIGQITADYAQFNAPSYQSNLGATQLQISDVANGFETTISSGIGLFNDVNSGQPIQVEVVADHTQDADPFIRLQNVNGLNNYIRYRGIYADGHFCFNLNNDNKFMKQQNAFSLQQYELIDGEFIEKYMPFVFAQNLPTGLKLYPANDYLDDAGLAGWSFIISNYSGGSINIDTTGLNWYAHSNGLNANPIVINKWVTCRITLVYSSIDNEYLWAVSQF